MTRRGVTRRGVTRQVTACLSPAGGDALDRADELVPACLLGRAGVRAAVALRVPDRLRAEGREPEQQETAEQHADGADGERGDRAPRGQGAATPGPDE